MNKKVVTLMVVLVFGSLLLTGCSTSIPFVAKTYTIEGSKVSSLIVDVRDREIEVSVSNDGLVHIDYFENAKEFYDISVSHDKVLTMKAVTNKDWKDFIGLSPAIGARKISIQVPDSHLSSLDLSTTKQDLILFPLTVNGSVTLSSNGGNITFEKMDVKTMLKVTGKNGNIRGTVAGSHDDFSILTTIKKGKTNLSTDLKDKDKRLEVSNNNGNINITFQ